MKGTLYGIGVGPGDPELLTLKAARLIESAPAIAFVCNRDGASRARQTVLRHLRPDKTEIPIVMAMAPDEGRAAVRAAYAAAAERIAAELDRGRDVAALCEGDPFLYGSFIHLLEAMGRDCACCIVPGISSIAAAAAAAHKPLVSQAERLAVVSAGTEDAVASALEAYDSVAILKPSSNRARILELLRASGRSSETVYVSAASHDSESVVSDIGELPATPGPYFALFLVSRHCSR